MSRQVMTGVVLAGVLISLVFVLFPALDIWASSLAYSPESGFVAINPQMARLRTIGHLVTVTVPVVLILVVLLKLMLPERALLIDGRAGLFLLTSLLAGPALLVNVIFKETWGRPRPREIETFGGTSEMMPAWVPGGACDSNCSFMSGEASGAFWVLALAALAPAPWRAAAYLAALVYAAAIAAIRFVSGAHFLSDILLAAITTYLCIALAYDLLIRRDPPWARPQALDAALTKLGRRLRRPWKAGSTDASTRSSGISWALTRR